MGPQRQQYSSWARFKLNSFVRLLYLSSKAKNLQRRLSAVARRANNFAQLSSNFSLLLIILLFEHHGFPLGSLLTSPQESAPSNDVVFQKPKRFVPQKGYPSERARGAEYLHHSPLTMTGCGLTVPHPIATIQLAVASSQFATGVAKGVGSSSGS